MKCGLNDEIYTKKKVIEIHIKSSFKVKLERLKK